MPNIGPEPPGSKPESEAPSRSLTPAEDRARLLAEQLARSRAESRARVAESARHGPPHDLERIQAEAARYAATIEPSPGAAPVSAGRALPPSVQSAAGLRVVNDKIWEADVRPIKRPVNTDGWLSLVRSLARGRVLGDPFAVTITRVAETLVWQFRKARTGFARLTHETIAGIAQIDPGTVRRSIRWLEGKSLVDTFNTLKREDGQVLRAANLYLFTGLEPEQPPPEPKDEIERRSSNKLIRYARLFGLRARSWGLNATPLAYRWAALPSPETDPAPA